MAFPRLYNIYLPLLALFGLSSKWNFSTFMPALDYYVAQLNHLEMESNIPHQAEARKEHPFSQISREAYGYIHNDTAKQQEDSAANTPKPFDLSTWQRGTGGLEDNDRLAIARIYGEADSVFEYGLGESTYIANHVGVNRYAGIDSDPLWVHNARSQVADHFRFYLADIGATGKWGYPKKEHLAKAIYQYQLAPLLDEPEAFDVYMVDGRYRLACMFASFLHASQHGGDPEKTTVLLHDCHRTSGKKKKLRSGAEKSYKAVEAFFDVGHSGGRLCIYTRRNTTTDGDLLELWHEHHQRLG